MLTNKTITLYHYNGEVWSKIYVGRASVFVRKQGEEAGKVQHNYKGFSEAFPATVRIPEKGIAEISVGDRVYLGIYLGQTPPKENILYVKAVTDNRCGSENMQHWRLDCE